MNSFPFMKRIAGKKCLLVGGGNVALRKAEKLIPFGPELTVCAEALHEELLKLPVRVFRRGYDRSLLKDMDFVIAATDDRAVNAQISKDCRECGIAVNSVDDPENCDFFFPAIICRGDITIGISTGGSSPALAAVVREYLESVLPSDLGDISKECARLREEKKGSEYVSAVRSLFYRSLRKENEK